MPTWLAFLKLVKEEIKRPVAALAVGSSLIACAVVFSKRYAAAIAVHASSFNMRACGLITVRRCAHTVIFKPQRRGFMALKPGPKPIAKSTGKPDQRRRDNKTTPGNTPSLKPSKSSNPPKK